MISWKRAVLFEVVATVFGLIGPVAVYLKHGPYDISLATKIFLFFFIGLHVATIVEAILRSWSYRKFERKNSDKK